MVGFESGGAAPLCRFIYKKTKDLIFVTHFDILHWHLLSTWSQWFHSYRGPAHNRLNDLIHIVVQHTIVSMISFILWSSTQSYQEQLYPNKAHVMIAFPTEMNTWFLRVLTDPRIFGSLVVSILPTSQVIIFVTGSNEYFPCVGASVTFSTDFGNGISRMTFST